MKDDAVFCRSQISFCGRSFTNLPMNDSDFEKSDHGSTFSTWVMLHGQGQKKYRVFLKTVLHKCEEKMQEKVKMASQKDKNLAQVQLQCSVHFCIKRIFR